jgi:hypothetical protein
MKRRSHLALLICTLCSVGRGEKDVPESCEGLDNIGNSERLECVPSEDCLSALCNVTNPFTGYGAIVHLLPCDQPPALEILLLSPDAVTSVWKFDSSTPSRTTSVPLTDDTNSFSVEFRMTVSWAAPHAATIMSEIVGADFTLIILDSTNITLPACTQGPRPATTCLALQKVAGNANEALQCTTNGVKDCDTVMCTAKLETFSIDAVFKVLPCYSNLPAVSVIVKAGTSVFVDEILSESKEITLFQMTVNATLVQLDRAIGLQVELVTDDGGKEELLSYSEIPIDRTQCTTGEQGTEPSETEATFDGRDSASLHSLTSWQILCLSLLLPPYHFLL